MSKLSEALAAMDKATPGPWEAIKPVNSNGFWYINNHSTSSGEIATNYGEKAMYNANIIAAAPDALAWIKEALPYITEYRDALATNLENCDFGPREEGAARKELAHLDALIARAKPEEGITNKSIQYDAALFYKHLDALIARAKPEEVL